jgi:BirA family transcriptional regulator, biotin operon repressor / biotin---[acetyl-CoA-carboxylase] ligase
VEALRARLANGPLGDPLIYLPVIGSTNRHASELARSGAQSGTLVLTDEQPEGRGRMGRRWRSMPRQQILMSLVLRPKFPAHFLMMAAALAVAEAIESVAGVLVEIKWPNDVLHDGRKLCGILIETGTGDAGPHAILGIGLNVNGSLEGDAELGATATTLASAAGHLIAREELMLALLRGLWERYNALTSGGAPARAALREAWRARLVTLGRTVRITQGDAALEGMAEEVDDGGALLLRLPSGESRTILWGDVS